MVWKPFISIIYKYIMVGVDSLSASSTVFAVTYSETDEVIQSYNSLCLEVIIMLIWNHTLPRFSNHLGVINSDNNFFKWTLLPTKQMLLYYYYHRTQCPCRPWLILTKWWNEWARPTSWMAINRSICMVLYMNSIPLMMLILRLYPY